MKVEGQLRAKRLGLAVSGEWMIATGVGLSRGGTMVIGSNGLSAAGSLQTTGGTGGS